MPLYQSKVVKFGGLVIIPMIKKALTVDNKLIIIILNMQNL